MSFPQASNNEAEYEALLHGMKMAKACGATRLKIFGDSNLVVQQVMNHCDTISDNMTAYQNLYYYLEGTFDGCEVSHISRACRCSGYRGIPVHLLLGPVIGPSSAQGRINDPTYGEDPHEEAPREENDDRNC
jgi:hypothetical protein